jgi:hypothetical protein
MDASRRGSSICGIHHGRLDKAGVIGFMSTADGSTGVRLSALPPRRGGHGTFERAANRSPCNSDDMFEEPGQGLAVAD